MSTTKQNFAHLDLVRGLSKSAAASAASEGTWREAFGFRFLDGYVVQFPRLLPLMSVQPVYPHAVTGLVNLPGPMGYGKTLALTPAHVFRMPVGASDPSTVIGRQVFAESATQDFPFVFDTQRWGTVVYKSRLYFVKPDVPVCNTDGERIKVPSDVPAGQYVDVFFDHLMIGRAVWRGECDPYAIRWSHLRVFDEFEARTNTEADVYRVNEHQRPGSLVRGITGMGRLHDLMFVHTPDGIFGFQYVGLPKVLQEVHTIVDRGCGFPFGLAQVDSKQYFPSMHDWTFYEFDGQQVVDIGGPIRVLFHELITSDVTYALRLWSFVDTRYREIWWVFPSTTGPFDRAVIFNYGSRIWYAAKIPAITAFCVGTNETNVIAELSGTIQNLTGSIENLGKGGVAPTALFGSEGGMIAKETEEIASLPDTLYSTPPELLTNQSSFGSIQQTKEWDTVTIHTTAKESEESPFGGVEVYHDTKHNLALPDSFTLAGTWTLNQRELRLGKPRVHGKSNAWKFVYKGDSPTTATESGKLTAYLRGASFSGLPFPVGSPPFTPGTTYYDPPADATTSDQCVDGDLHFDFFLSSVYDNNSGQYINTIGARLTDGQFNNGQAIPVWIERLYYDGGAWVPDPSFSYTAGAGMYLTATPMGGGGSWIDPCPLDPGTWYGYRIWYMDMCGGMHCALVIAQMYPVTEIWLPYYLVTYGYGAIFIPPCPGGRPGGLWELNHTSTPPAESIVIYPANWEYWQTILNEDPRIPAAFQAAYVPWSTARPDHVQYEIDAALGPGYELVRALPNTGRFSYKAIPSLYYDCNFLYWLVSGMCSTMEGAPVLQVQEDRDSEWTFTPLSSYAATFVGPDCGAYPCDRWRVVEAMGTPDYFHAGVFLDADETSYGSCIGLKFKVAYREAT